MLCFLVPTETLWTPEDSGPLAVTHSDSHPVSSPHSFLLLVLSQPWLYTLRVIWQCWEAFLIATFRKKKFLLSNWKRPRCNQTPYNVQDNTLQQKIIMFQMCTVPRLTNNDLQWLFPTLTDCLKYLLYQKLKSRQKNLSKQHTCLYLFTVWLFYSFR